MSIYNYRLSAFMRQRFYKMSGGERNYVDLGFKALACVNHDRRCAVIMKSRIEERRLQRELKEMEL